MNCKHQKIMIHTTTNNINDNDNYHYEYNIMKH